MGGINDFIIAATTAVGTLGGLGLIKFLFFMRPERRKVQAEAELKELEADEKELGVLRGLIESLQRRIEQQDKKISELNARIDTLYVEKHELEKRNNEHVKKINELELQLMEARHNVCVRPDDECFKGRMPKRTYCRLKKLAAGDYDAFYNGDGGGDPDGNGDGSNGKNGKEEEDAGDSEDEEHH